METANTNKSVAACNAELELASECLDLADKLGLKGTCSISTSFDDVNRPESKRAKWVPCLKTASPLTVALITRPADGTGVAFMLSITHKASGLAVQYPQFRYGLATKYEIPATPKGVAAAKAVIRALVDPAAMKGLELDWSKHVPTIPKSTALQWEIVKRLQDAMAPVFREADLAAMRDHREYLLRANPRMSEDKLNSAIRRVFWWNPTGWAMASSEIYEQDQRIQGCIANPLPI